jgi:alanine racemase
MLHHLQPPRPTWIEIDRAALVNNVQKIRQRLTPTCLLMAVVKANAYGHGLAETAIQLRAAGVDRFAVATLGEASELRQAGVDLPILVLGYTPPWLAAEAAAQQITLTVFDAATAIACDQAASVLGEPIAVHLKVNTGMNRLGVTPNMAPQLLTSFAQLPFLYVEGIFTHFATSDLSDKSFAWEQFSRFTHLLDVLSQLGLRPPLAHAANSAAMLTMPATHLDMVRCGIALYGLHPDPDETILPSGFHSVLTWKALVAQITHLAPGDSVSYGREFIAAQAMTVVAIPVGYADGFPRRPYHYGHVLIHGQSAPILGRVCMDQTIVDVTAIHAARPVKQGDEAVLIGRQGPAQITVDDVARQIRTNNYDTVSRILGRVPRIMV